PSPAAADKIEAVGTLASRIARPSKALLADLVRAYADEWHAHYNYYFVSKMVHGPSSAPISALLARKSDAALIRADRLALRLIQLGGRPAEKLGELPDLATDKPFKLPDDLADVEGLL